MQIKAPKDYGFTLERTVEDFSSENDLTKILPFKLEAENFIEYAREDMKGDSDKDLVNSLSNIKRAIENRLDGILFVFKYQRLSRDYDFPQKVRKLDSLGIISPQILKKINRIRNLLEHQYRVPKKQEVEDAYDVATLFLAYTRNFIKRNVTEYGCYLGKGKKPSAYLSLEFDDSGFNISLSKSGARGKCHVDPSDPTYDEWIKFTIKRLY